MPARITAFVSGGLWFIIGVTLLLVGATLMAVFTVPCMTNAPDCAQMQNLLLYEGLFGQAPQAETSRMVNLLGIAAVWLSSLALFGFYINIRAAIVADLPGYDIVTVSLGLFFLVFLLIGSSSINLLASRWIDRVESYYTKTLAEFEAVSDDAGDSAGIEIAELRATYTRYTERLLTYRTALPTVNLSAVGLGITLGIMTLVQGLVFARPSQSTYWRFASPDIKTDLDEYLKAYHDKSAVALKYTYAEAEVSNRDEIRLQHHAPAEISLQVKVRPIRAHLPAREPHLILHPGTAFTVSHASLPDGWNAPKPINQRGSVMIAGPAYLTDTTAFDMILKTTNSVLSQKSRVTHYTIGIAISTDNADHTSALPDLEVIIERDYTPAERRLEAIRKSAQTTLDNLRSGPERSPNDEGANA